MLLCNDFVYASESDESYDDEENEEDTFTDDEESEEDTTTDNEESEDDSSENNEKNLVDPHEQLKLIQEGKNKIYRTVDDVLGINPSAISAKKQKLEIKENKQLKKEVKKLSDEITALKKITKEANRHAKKTQKLVNQIKESQDLLAKQKQEDQKNQSLKSQTKKKSTSPKKKKKKKGNKKSKSTAPKKIYTVKKDQIREYENYLKDFGPRNKNPHTVLPTNTPISILSKQTFPELNYPMHQFGKLNKNHNFYFNDYLSDAKQDKITILKDKGISKFTVKNSIPLNPFTKIPLNNTTTIQSSTTGTNLKFDIADAKKMFGDQKTEQNYFKGKCGCQNKH